MPCPPWYVVRVRGFLGAVRPRRRVARTTRGTRWRGHRPAQRAKGADATPPGQPHGHTTQATWLDFTTEYKYQRHGDRRYTPSTGPL